MIRRVLICLAALWTVWCSVLLTAVLLEHSPLRSGAVRDILMLVAIGWFVCGVACWAFAFIKGAPTSRREIPS
jgi:multisubunit Na+/H+ antiporter MnhB subunit